ncbi:MAG: hydroxymethylpyrimidine/phosphomethylpyrimidine kinase [Blastocatellia bacterium]|jgi:hydroxymethylpyrimidine kinase/phosphomethylpyrimidine kinase|nr:hydroxymethylpyrimidine/phosphomethylpyrimidine kinase [Blastocatellia bacterium]
MPTDIKSTPVVLTIAGFDPSGGAGVLADVRTLVAFGCRPVAAITSLTFQNSKQVCGTIHQSAKSLHDQILPLVSEFLIAEVKIGMLPTVELVAEVVRLLGEKAMPAPIVDPVLKSSSGYDLMKAEAREVWLSDLMPLARLITPNIPEAETLTGISIKTEADMLAAAVALRRRGAQAVLIKGGHLEQSSEVRDQQSQPPGPQAIDLLDDDDTVTFFRGEWIEAPTVRGTGCMLSSAIAAGLAHGESLSDSVGAAKRFVASAIRTASGS